MALLVVFLLTGMTGCGEKPHENDPQEQLPAGDNDTPRDADEILVIFFSATGNTEKVAEMIASITGGKLIRIIASEPYSFEDLNYGDKTSRTSIEQNDQSARPGIENEISLEGCKTLYLGYPIWWGQAPRIMDSFVESHDFTGITVIPFCTSGSSDIGKSDDRLAELAKSGNWLQGKRFPGSVSRSMLEEWIREVGQMEKEKTMRLYINETEIPVSWQSNEAVSALKDLLSSGDLTVEMSMYGGFEQVGPLGTSLPRDDKQTVTGPGDIVLYSGNQIVIFYGTNSWSYTRLGHVDLSEEELAELLGHGDVIVKLTLQ